MVSATRRVAVLLAALLAPLFCLAPRTVAAAPAPAMLLQTAPCYTAAIQALTRRGAIYSQGGYLSGDPIDPSTGTYYPRTGPDSFDCSGLVWWAYAQAGVSVGATTYQQLDDGVSIPCTLANLAGSSTTCWTLGDLIFLQYTGGNHVAIYVGDGLFMDCYNHSTGCILHDVTTDSFYAAHFSQARRIVSGCEGFTNSPGTPSGPIDTPAPDANFDVQAPADWSTIPDVVGYFVLSVPQCGGCNPVSAGIAPIPEPEGNWLDVGSWINWLGIRIYNIIINLICQMFMMLQVLANFLALIANAFLYIVNITWRFAVFAWLTIKAWLYAVVVFFELLRAAVWQAVIVLSGLANTAGQLLQLLVLVAGLVGQLVTVLASIGGAAIGLLSWIGGLTLGLISALLLALQGTGAPAPISSATDHIAYRMVRGTIDGLLDSQIGWLFYLAMAFAYGSFIVWVSRFLPARAE